MLEFKQGTLGLLLLTSKLDGSSINRTKFGVDVALVQLVRPLIGFYHPVDASLLVPILQRGPLPRGHLSTIGISIPLGGEFELDAFRLGNDLINTLLFLLGPLPATFLVAVSIALAPFLGHLATIFVGIALSSKLQLDAVGLSSNFFSPALVFLLSNAAPLEIVEQKRRKKVFSLESVKQINVNDSKGSCLCVSLTSAFLKA